jgi:hypothetical protein
VHVVAEVLDHLYPSATDQENMSSVPSVRLWMPLSSLASSSK